MKNTEIRKKIAKLKRSLAQAENRQEILQQIYTLQNQKSLPTLGQFRQLIDKDVKQEEQTIDSPTDLKRLATKEAILDYYNRLEYDPETQIVDYEGSLRLRRDNQKTDSTDYDFAPDYSKIYEIYMDKIRTLVRHSQLHRTEYDEAAERGIIRGGAFEKQLTRLIKEYLTKIWRK